MQIVKWKAVDLAGGRQMDAFGFYWQMIKWGNLLFFTYV